MFTIYSDKNHSWFKKQEGLNSNLTNFYNIKLSKMEKIKLFFGICSKPKLRELLIKAKGVMSQEFDLIKIVQRIR